MTKTARPFSARVRVWLGWTLAILTIVLCGAATGLFNTLQGPLPKALLGVQRYFALTPIPAQAFAIVGALIVWRRPGNRIGWVCIAIGILWGFEEFVLGYFALARYGKHGPVPAAGLFEWLAGWVWILPVILTLFFLPFLFPNGEPVSPRWWPLAGWAVGGMTLATVGSITAIGLLTYSGQFIDLTSALLAPVTLVIRYRRARFEERQQIKWFAAAALLLAGLAVFSTAVSFIVYHTNTVVFNPVGGTLLPLGLTGLAVAIGVSVLRYHLYDIDVFLRRAIVYGALVVLISFTYLIIVVSIGTRINTPTVTDRAIPFALAAVIALIFQPVRTRLQNLANRLVYGRRASPYEVLANFSRGVSELYGDEDLTVRMARVLSEGTEADRAEVWLRVGDELRLAASWPKNGGTTGRLRLESGEPPAIPDAATAVPVRYQGELLGTLAVVKREDMTPIETRLVNDLAHEAGLVLKNERLTAELSQRLEELTLSRQRLVTAQDTERRRIERNLHDGAQQDLVAMKLKLAAAKGMAERDPQRTQALLEGLLADVNNAVETLRELARGIYPPILVDGGLEAALDAQGARSPLTVEIHPDSIRRYPSEVEAAVYFCCLEALQNAVKHAQATKLVIDLEERDGELRFSATDNGQGIDLANARGGSGIQNMVDRVAALGGTLEVRPSPNGGTRVSGRLPVRARHETPAPA